MSKTCKKCGSLNRDSALKCENCGARLNSSFNEKLLSLFYPFCHGDETALSADLFSVTVALALPFLFFFILFLTLFIDKNGLGYEIPGFPFFILMSAVYGYGSVVLQTVLAFIVCKVCKKNTKIVSSAIFFSFGYTIPFIMALLGLIFRAAFGWSLIIFGILGLLMSLIPLWNYLSLKIKNRLVNAGMIILYGFVLCLVSNLLFSMGTV